MCYVLKSDGRHPFHSSDRARPLRDLGHAAKAVSAAERAASGQAQGT